MTNDEIEKYKQELTELSKTVKTGDFPDIDKVYQQIETLAIKTGAPLLSAIMLDADRRWGQNSKLAKLYNCGEIINNIHRVLQTEEMFNACVSAEQSCELAKQSSLIANRACFWAAVAAGASVVCAITSLLYLLLR